MDTAVEGEIYTEDTLEELTWDNLGWRLGRLFDETSEDLKEEIFNWCKKKQGQE